MSETFSVFVEKTYEGLSKLQPTGQLEHFEERKFFLKKNILLLSLLNAEENFFGFLA